MWVGIGNMSTILGLVCKYISLSISISIISMVLPFNYADYSVHNTTQNKLLPLFSTQPGYYFWCAVRDTVFILCGWITRSSDGSNYHHTNRGLLLWILSILLKYFYFVFRYFYFSRQKYAGSSAAHRSSPVHTNMLHCKKQNKIRRS